MGVGGSRNAPVLNALDKGVIRKTQDRGLAYADERDFITRTGDA